MSYTMYTPLNVWLDPASVTDVVAYIQTYLSENTIYSETEIETIIHDYLIAHPELIGGVQSVNGKTGTVVLSASDINTENNVTIESVLASLSSQISSIAASVATNTNNITSLTGRVSTAETDLANLKSNFDDTLYASGEEYDRDDLTEHQGWYIRSANGTIGGGETGRGIGWMKCIPMTTYTVTISPSWQYFKIGYTKSVPVGDLQVYDIKSGSDTLTIKPADDAKYLVVQLNDGATITINNSQFRFALQTEVEINSKRQTAVYFSNGNAPFFQKISRGSTTVIKVLFPNGDFRLYGETGQIYSTTAYQGAEFTISLLNKLVFDYSDNSIKTVAMTASGNYIDLVSNVGGAVDGALSKYFIENNDYYEVQEWYDILSAYKDSAVRFLFFSDVHGSGKNVSRILNKATSFGERVNAVINGGDTVSTALPDGADWYNTLVNSSSVDVLNCVGNHDTWTSQETQAKANQSDVYAAFIAPMVSRVENIIQPTGGSESGLLYYYKDYSDIRVIVLDAMITSGGTVVGWWDSDELTWFQNVLADAITNNKKVVCVAHPPFNKTYAIRDDDSPVNSWIDYRTASYYDSLQIPNDAVNAVDTFITNGGVFICWLSGHTHVDNVLTATGHTGQVMVNIGSSNYNKHMDGTNFYIASTSREKWYDCYDYIAIDTTHNQIKVARIGYNEDSSMRVRRRFCYDYVTKKLLSVS